VKKKALSLFVSLLAPAGSASAESVRVYVGTYTSGDSQGIYRLQLDLATGALTPDGPPTPADNPSFLAWSPDGTRLFAVEETGEVRTATSGGVRSFAVDPKTGALAPLNRQPSGGAGPCHVSVSPDGRHVFVANYSGGSVAAFPVGADGRIGPQSAFVQHEAAGDGAVPHAHSVDLDPAGTRLVVADLGLDAVFAYPFDRAKGSLGAPTKASLPKGSGPRHVAFHPDGRHLYVIDELNATVTVLGYADGAFRALQTVPTLPAGFEEKNSTAEIAVSPDGRFVYGSNRGHDSIAIFAVDPAQKTLTPAGHQPSGGRHPRHFAIDPTGAFLLAANRDSDNVVVFRIDRKTGGLTPVGEPVRVPRAVCLLMRRGER
jgi:6-phosphogluconolactonase